MTQRFYTIARNGRISAGAELYLTAGDVRRRARDHDGETKWATLYKRGYRVEPVDVTIVEELQP